MKTKELFEQGMKLKPKVNERYIYRKPNGSADESFVNLRGAIKARDKDLYRNKGDNYDSYWNELAEKSKIIHQVTVEKVLDI